MTRTLAVTTAVLAVAGVLVLGREGASPPGTTPLQWPAGLPVYAHVVIVVEENKDYDEVIDNPAAPYINDTLCAEGASLTQMFAEEHYSQGNYFWLFSGSNHNVGFKDVVPSKQNHPAYPFKSPNLGASLIAKGHSFKGYAEDLPAVGSDADTAKPYARKHVPWISFSNLPTKDTPDTCNLRFADFPTDSSKFGDLPTVSIVVPNLKNDMHDGKPEYSVPRGDAWIKKHIDPYYQWAKTHNSLLIVTWDESDSRSYVAGLTNPFIEPSDQLRKDLQNRIATIFAGAHIKPGDYPEGKGVTHVNLLRTLEAMYGLPRAGAQQPNAAGGGIRDDFIITDVFKKAD